MKSPATLIATTAFALGALCLPAAAYQCKGSPTQSFADQPVKLTAQANAKANWTNVVKSDLGLSWSVWKIAADKDVVCNKVASGKWHCVASAKPCNYVVQ